MTDNMLPDSNALNSFISNSEADRQVERHLERKAEELKKKIEMRKKREAIPEAKVMEICIMPQTDQEEEKKQQEAVSDLMYQYGGGDVQKYNLTTPKNRKPVKNKNKTVKALEKTTMHKKVEEIADTNRFTRKLVQKMKDEEKKA